MDLKVQVDDDGSAYVAAIDPNTGEHRKAATVAKGEEVTIDLNSLTLDDVEFGEVVASGVDKPGGGNEGSPVNSGEAPAAGGGEEVPAKPPAGNPGPDSPPAGEGGSGTDTPPPGPGSAGEEVAAPTTSAASEKPLYLVDGETPVGFELSGLETPDGKTLYHFAGDTAGQSATGNADAVSVYADADDNEKPVQPAQEAPAS